MNHPDMTEAGVADWLGDVYAEAGMYVGPRGKEGRSAMARAVLALVEAKVREAIEFTRADAYASCECDSEGFGQAFLDWDHTDDEIVSRVMKGTA